MATFLYAPGIRIFVQTLNYGHLEVTGDIVSGEVTRRVGPAVSTMSLRLANHRRKYDGVFTPNDRISVRMKRIRWVQVFAGYLNQVPYYSAWPGGVMLSASCSLKRLQYRLWDPGTEDAYVLLHTDDINSPDSEALDGGMKRKAIRVINEVGGWPKSTIHIGELPREWIEKVSELWSTMEERVETPARQLGASATMNGASLIPGPTQQDAAGPGTGSLPATSGRISWFGGPGGGAYGNMALTGESGVRPADDWFCAMRWQYVTNTGGRYLSNADMNAAISWWRNRRIAVTNPTTGRSIILRAADWGPHHTTGRVIDVSRQAMSLLGVTTDQVVHISFAPSQDMAPGRVLEHTGDLHPADRGHLIRQRSTPGSAGGMVFPAPMTTGYSDTWLAPRSGMRWGTPGHKGTDIMAPNGSPALAVVSGEIVQVSNSNSGNAGLSVRLKGDDDHYYIYLHNRRNFVSRGERVVAGQQIAEVGHTGNASSTSPHIHFEIHPGRIGNPVNPYPFLKAAESGTTYMGLTDMPGQGSITNVWAWQGQPDPRSGLLSGARALINDRPLMETVTSLMSAGLREFCSAPNGDFIAWFPDHFDLYGIASKMVLRDIEILDLTVTWSDANLKTHQFVIGSSTGVAEIRDIVGGAAIQAFDEAFTMGIVSVEMVEVMEALLNVRRGDNTGWANPEAMLARFGPRVAVKHDGLISSPYAEFWSAMHEFMRNWSAQFSAQVSLTFMPELYPGMLLQLPGHGLQVYIDEVTHRFDFTHGGFTTQVATRAPSALEGGGLYGLPRAGEHAKRVISPAHQPQEAGSYVPGTQGVFPS